MNKKILISLSVIGAVAAIAVGGTIAYFSDVETSTGNTFTAGSLDLIVDIDGVQYNPLNRAIFTVTDMKPGDKGEETLSLRVVDNPACGFISFNLASDLDNSCTEPEATEEGVGCPLPVSAPAEGELNDNVVWTIWLDQGTVPGWQCGNTPKCTEDLQEGDNVRQQASEPILTTGTLTGDRSWSIGELPTGNAFYYGFAWELPSTVTNIVQSDSFTADMVITAKQKRNQYTNCPVLGLIQ